MQIKVTKAFLVRGERQEIGSVIDLPDALAREMIALQRAERPAGAAPEPPPSGPMTTNSAGGLVSGRKRKED